MWHNNLVPILIIASNLFQVVLTQEEAVNSAQIVPRQDTEENVISAIQNSEGSQQTLQNVGNLIAHIFTQLANIPVAVLTGVGVIQPPPTPAPEKQNTNTTPPAIQVVVAPPAAAAAAAPQQIAIAQQQQQIQPQQIYYQIQPAQQPAPAAVAAPQPQPPPGNEKPEEGGEDSGEGEDEA